ncbi:hypothetical protein [Holdemania massiliensis]|uniref:hypothetical protein n=1 Tax=Holdemania massiliensis TaxID=1468449 RepID=UPI0002EF895D|nr:hypothetical protein [Holdemania massiliensis]
MIKNEIIRKKQAVVCFFAAHENNAAPISTFLCHEIKISFPAQKIQQEDFIAFAMPDKTRESLPSVLE